MVLMLGVPMSSFPAVHRTALFSSILEAEEEVILQLGLSLLFRL